MLLYLEAGDGVQVTTVPTEVGVGVTEPRHQRSTLSIDAPVVGLRQAASAFNCGDLSVPNEHVRGEGLVLVAVYDLDIPEDDVLWVTHVDSFVVIDSFVCFSIC